MIKTTTVLFVAMMLLSPVFSQAQSNKKNIIKANVLSPTVRSYNLYYERVVGKKVSIQLGVGWQPLRFEENSIVGPIISKYQGLRVTPEIRYYPAANDSRRAPKGFFVGGYWMYQYYTATSEKRIFILDAAPKKGHAHLQTWGGGALLGYQWLKSGWLSVDLFVGISPFNHVFRIDKKATNDGFEYDDFNAVKVVGFFNNLVRFGGSIGVAF